MQCDNMKYYIPVPSLAFTYRHYYGNIRLAYRALYKLPNLNDLYWRPGGNPSLKAEYAEWASLDFQWYMEEQLDLKTSLYEAEIDNWIRWEPDSFSWRAVNIEKVWLCGVDVYVRTIPIKGLPIRVEGGMSYLRIREDDKAYQLIYVPRWQGFAMIEYALPQGWIRMGSRYVGKRYITSTNSRWLSPYLLVGLWGGLNYRWRQWKVELLGSIENLTNVAYETVPGMPMPAVNASMGIQISRLRKPPQ